MATAAAASSAYTSYVAKIPGRTNIPEDAVSNPHHVVNRSGKTTGFKNPYPSYKDPQIWSQVVWPQLKGQLRFPSPDRTNPVVPGVKPQLLHDRFGSTALRATWLGHACYYVEFPSGMRVLFDPVFEPCCSPWPVSMIGPRRFTPKPCDIADLPTVDAVVISHSHYDHLSYNSVMDVQKHHPNTQFFVGLGLESWFRRCGINNVTELDWWEDAELTVKVPSERATSPDAAIETKPGATTTASSTRPSTASTSGPKQPMTTLTARLSCLPCQHTSSRTGIDKDKTLWCSWAVNSGGRSVWFGGDTGYRAVPVVPEGTDDYGPEYAHLPRCPQFKQIGDLRGPFDLSLIPIGAYAPRAAFSGMHANPFDAVEIFSDTKSRRAMGIHWGTWALTSEEVLEPPLLLKEALRRKGIAEEGVFDVCNIGETREF